MTVDILFFFSYSRPSLLSMRAGLVCYPASHSSEWYQHSLSSWQPNISNWDSSALLQGISVNVCQKDFRMYELYITKVDFFCLQSDEQPSTFFFLFHVWGHKRGRRQTLQNSAELKMLTSDFTRPRSQGRFLHVFPCSHSGCGTGLILI